VAGQKLAAHASIGDIVEKQESYFVLKLEQGKMPSGRSPICRFAVQERLLQGRPLFVCAIGNLVTNLEIPIFLPIQFTISEYAVLLSFG
jgi:hypothetical protein